jgi:uncharacterized protein (TIGR02246 family)
MNTLESRLAALERRAQRAEDVLAIHNLMADYSNAADGGWNRATHDPDAVAALFTEDGVWEGDKGGKVEGRAAIRELFAYLQKTTPFAFHTMANPRIEVNGDSAVGQWHLILFLVTGEGAVVDRPLGDIFGTGIYTNHFVRTPAGWRFRKIQCTAAFLEPFLRGWKCSLRR